MKISIALCTYNGIKFLPELLDSIGRQTILPHEMIISDDASTDDTYALLEKFQTKHPFTISIFQSEKTRGVNRNHEFVFQQCTGDIILVADQDDVWYDNKIEMMSDYITQNNATAVFANAELIDESGENIQGLLWEKYDFDYNANSNARSLLKRLLLSNVVTGSTLAITKDGLQHTLPFPETALFLYDEWIACVIAAHPQFSIVPYNHVTMQYRIHERQFTARDNQLVEGAFPYNWSAYFQPIEVRQRLLELLALRLGKHGIDEKEVEESRNLWDLRLSNCRNFTVLNKMQLTASFMTGQYHRFVRRPFEAWVKDLIAWPHRNSNN